MGFRPIPAASNFSWALLIILCHTKTLGSVLHINPFRLFQNTVLIFGF